MFTKIAQIVLVLGAYLKKEPALMAALLNIAVGAFAYFGLNVSPEQLVAIVGGVTAILAILVRQNVIPVSKANKEAVIKELETPPEQK